MLHQLANNLPPSSSVEAALHKICGHAKSRKVAVCIDAEQTAFQHGIDTWTMALQQQYNKLHVDNCYTPNKDQPPKAVVYNTYQAYLHSTPPTLARHLDYAAREGFVLGIKLVRGAYLASDSRELMWKTKAETDAVYDNLASSLIKRQYGDVLVPMQWSESDTLPTKVTRHLAFPEVNLVLATHNLLSARKALALRSSQVAKQEPRIEMVYGQLMGMADHVSGELVAASNAGQDGQTQTDKHDKHTHQDAEQECIDRPRTCKYLVWGSVSQCAKYLVRRAEENRDAVTRTVEARKLLGKELWRRVWGG